MTTFKKHKLIEFIVFSLGLFLLECFSFAFMGIGFFPSYFYLDLCLFILLGVPIFFFKNTWFDSIYYSLIFFFILLVCLVNINYYKTTGGIFSLKELSLIKGTDKEIFNEVHWLSFSILLIYTLLILFFIWFFNIKYKIKIDILHSNKKQYIFSSLALVVALAVYPSSMAIAVTYERNIKNNVTMDCITYASNYNFKRLGIFSYYIKEAMFLNGGLSMSDSKIKEYCVNTKAEKNDFTGLCKDMNVITVMIETGDRYMVNEYTTPNLYNFLKNGVDCSSNYCKNMTGTSELIGISGNYYSKGLGKIKDIEMPFAMPNILSSNGYQTIYSHDFGKFHDLYLRRINIPQIGFKKTYFHEELFPTTPEWEWSGNYSLDSQFIDAVLNKLDPSSGKFYLNLTTLNMHYPYWENDGNKTYMNLLKTNYLSSLNDIKEKKLWVNPLEGTKYNSYASELDIYMLKCMDFDKGFGNLLTYLSEKNLEDNTLVCVFGDHNIYHRTKDKKYQLKQLVKGIVNTEKHIDLFDTVLGFSNPTINSLFHEKFKSNVFPYLTSNSNVAPTILDLLGVMHNPIFYYDKSLFSNNYNKNQILFSQELSIFMNKNYGSSDGCKIDVVFNDNNTRQQFLTSCLNRIKNQYLIDCVYSKNVFKNNNYNDFMPKE